MARYRTEGSLGTVSPAGTVGPTPCRNRAPGYLEGVPGQAIARGLTKLMRETCGVEEVVLFWADGGNVRQLAEGVGVSRGWMATQLKKLALKLGEEVGEDFVAMRAESLEQENLDDAEDVEPDRDAIQKAKLVIEQRHRIAAALDPKTWGEKGAAPPVNIFSTGDLHLLAVSDPNVAREAKQRFLATQPAPKALPSGQEK